MANNFINRVEVSGNLEQLREYGKELEKMGYSLHYEYLDDKKATFLESYENLERYTIYCHSTNTMYKLPEDKELALGLAAMREGDDFHVGEYIRVTNKGNSYDTFTKMFKELNFKNIEEKDLPTNGTVGKIFAVKEHPVFPDTIMYAFITESGEEYLIGSKGVQKLTTEELINHFKNQKQSMKQFSVSSESKTLKQAFINELKEKGWEPMGRGSDGTFINEKDAYLSPCKNYTKQYMVERKKETNYILPQDWDRALKAFEDYAKEEEFTSVIVGYTGGALEFKVKKSGIVVTDPMDSVVTDLPVDIKMLENVSHIPLAVFNSSWDITPATVNIGCKKEISIEDLKKVLNTYNRLNNK